MPLRWCIGKSTAALLAGEHSRQRGHWVVLSVVHERAGEVDRRVVKLEKMMEYLQFHRAGRHYVYAALVQSPAGDLSGEQRVKLLDRDSPRSYSRPLFVDIDGERLLYKPQFLEQGLSLTLICHTSIEVVVPEQFFAKEPSPRMIRWLHWFLRTPAPDQCALRRKAIFAFTLQPILAIPWLLAKYVLFPPLSIGVNLAWAILATLLGIRPNRQGYGVDWSQVFRPFRGNLKSVWDGDFKPGEGAGISGGSFIMFKPNGNKYRSRWRWLLLPLAHTLLFAAGFSMVFFRGAGLSKSALSGLAVVLAGLLGAVVVLSVSTTLAAVRRRRKSRGVLRRVETARVEEERQATLQQAREEQVRVALQRLSCEVVPLEVSVYALPPERQTIYLHFMRLKARVCLPRRLS